MAGLFDGAFVPAGNGILPDWLFNPQPFESRPNAMAGGTPAGSFADLWSGVPQGMSLGLLDPRGTNNNVAYDTSAPLPSAGTSFADRFGASYGAPMMASGTQTFPGGDLPMPVQRPPEAQQAYNRTLITPGLELPPEAAPTAGVLPPNLGGNPMPGTMSGGGFDPLGIAGPGQPLGGAAEWINNNRNMLALFGAGIAGGGGTGSWNAGVADALKGMVAGGKMDSESQGQKAALQYVAQAQDIDPAMKNALLQNPALATQYMQSRFKGGTSSEIAEFEYAKKQGFKGTLQDWIANKRAGAGEFALNPIWGKDAQGNVIPLQLGKSGTATVSKLPEGVTVQGKDTIKLDAGTHFVLLDPLTRQPVGTVKKDIIGKERDEEIGKASGIAQVGLPGYVASAERMISRLDELENHPGKQWSLGPIMGRVPAMGGKQADFIERLSEIQGGAFLEAYKSLRGTGSISEAEGKKAEQAFARLGRIKDEGDFKTAINDIRGAIRIGVENEKKKAQQAPAAAAPTIIQRPDLKSLKDKYGLE